LQKYRNVKEHQKWPIPLRVETAVLCHNIHVVWICGVTKLLSTTK